MWVLKIGCEVPADLEGTSQGRRIKQKVSRKKYYDETETQTNPDDDEHVHGE